MYWDNAGGGTSDAVVLHGLRQGARIVVCGQIAMCTPARPGARDREHAGLRLPGSRRRPPPVNRRGADDSDQSYPPPLPPPVRAHAEGLGIRRERYLVLDYRQHFASALGASASSGLEPRMEPPQPPRLCSHALWMCVLWGGYAAELCGLVAAEELTARQTVWEVRTPPPPCLLHLHLLHLHLHFPPPRASAARPRPLLR